MFDTFATYKTPFGEYPPVCITHSYTNYLYQTYQPVIPTSYYLYSPTYEIGATAACIDALNIHRSQALAPLPFLLKTP
jgi:hypothetical protein